MSLYATYILADPTTGAIRYVGKTKQKTRERLRRHVRDALEKSADGAWADRTHRANWIRSLLNHGQEPVLKEIYHYATLEEVNAAERFLIRHIRPVKPDLTNTTDGGDGGIVSRKPACDDGIVIRAYQGGMTSRQIASKYKTCRKRVLGILKQAGVEMRPARRVKRA